MSSEFSKDDTTKFNVSISDVDPVKDYENLMENRQHYDPESGVIFAEIWEQICYAVCDCIWKLLFDDTTPSEDQINKAKELLKKFRLDSKIINPYVYNGFQDKLRDECLNHNNLREFWKSLLEDDDDDDTDIAPAVPPCGEVYYNFMFSRIVTPLNTKTSPKQDVVLKSEDFDKNLPLAKLLENYESAKKQIDAIHIADDKFNDIWIQFHNLICDCVWSFIIDAKPSPNEEQIAKACGLLKRYRDDAVYINWSMYNEWMEKFREQLLENGMEEFLQKEIIAKQLGLCRSFRAMQENQILKAVNLQFAATEVDFSELQAKLPLAELLDLYHNAMDNKMDMDWETFSDIWQQFSEAVCNCIWQIMFNDTGDTASLTSAQMEKASVLLKTYREDSIMINPTFYNEWIYKFRDELLKREFYDFWKNEIVKKELGPCWARDSDFFDDMDDPEPAEFYNYAGCQAAWLSEAEGKETAEEKQQKPEIANTTPKSTKPISLSNPLEDYTHNMLVQRDLDMNDKAAYKKIFSEIRHVLWQLLFGNEEKSLSQETINKASSLLQAHKEDACYFSPYEYNEWIVKVRDELVKRKYCDFWQIIVDNNLGLCSANDSHFFHNRRDPKPKEFYRIGTELMAV